MKPLAFVLGTRPEIIKTAPAIHAATAAGIPFVLIHTNQHYSAELDTVFFKDLSLDPPAHNLQVGAGTQSEQTARMIERLEPLLREIDPAWVIVQGDTNSVLAGALVASKLTIPVAHIEAGLRSYDRTMPEEINRIVTDHISSAHFPPTPACAKTLKSEGIAESSIHTVGNTVVDAVLQNAARCTEAGLKQFQLNPQGYVLLTLHRPSNVDAKEDLEAVFSALEEVSPQLQVPFVLPIHPRTKGALEKHSIQVPGCVQIIDPVGYLEMLTLQKFAAYIFTDSGGIQEEACILTTPCLTLRENTERPETVEVGANVLVGRDPQKMRAALDHFAHKKTWENPFGDGTAGEQIIQILSK